MPQMIPLIALEESRQAVALIPDVLYIAAVDYQCSTDYAQAILSSKTAREEGKEGEDVSVQKVLTRSSHVSSPSWSSSPSVDRGKNTALKYGSGGHCGGDESCGIVASGVPAVFERASVGHSAAHTQTEIARAVNSSGETTLQQQQQQQQRSASIAPPHTVTAYPSSPFSISSSSDEKRSGSCPHASSRATGRHVHWAKEQTSTTSSNRADETGGAGGGGLLPEEKLCELRPSQCRCGSSSQPAFTRMAGSYTAGQRPPLDKQTAESATSVSVPSQLPAPPPHLLLTEVIVLDPCAVNEAVFAAHKSHDDDDVVSFPKSCADCGSVPASSPQPAFEANRLLPSKSVLMSSAKSADALPSLQEVLCFIRRLIQLQKRLAAAAPGAPAASAASAVAHRPRGARSDVDRDANQSCSVSSGQLNAVHDEHHRVHGGKHSTAGAAASASLRAGANRPTVIVIQAGWQLTARARALCLAGCYCVALLGWSVDAVETQLLHRLYPPPPPLPFAGGSSPGYKPSVMDVVGGFADALQRGWVWSGSHPLKRSWHPPSSVPRRVEAALESAEAAYTAAKEAEHWPYCTVIPGRLALLLRTPCDADPLRSARVLAPLLRLHRPSTEAGPSTAASSSSSFQKHPSPSHGTCPPVPPALAGRTPQTLESLCLIVNVGSAGDEYDPGPFLQRAIHHAHVGPPSSSDCVSAPSKNGSNRGCTVVTDAQVAQFVNTVEDAWRESSLVLASARDLRQRQRSTKKLVAVHGGAQQQHLAAALCAALLVRREGWQGGRALGWLRLLLPHVALQQTEVAYVHTLSYRIVRASLFGSPSRGAHVSSSSSPPPSIAPSAISAATTTTAQAASSAVEDCKTGQEQAEDRQRDEARPSSHRAAHPHVAGVTLRVSVSHSALPEPQAKESSCDASLLSSSPSSFASSSFLCARCRPRPATACTSRTTTVFTVTSAGDRSRPASADPRRRRSCPHPPAHGARSAASSTTTIPAMSASTTTTTTMTTKVPAVSSPHPQDTTRTESEAAMLFPSVVSTREGKGSGMCQHTPSRPPPSVCVVHVPRPQQRGKTARMQRVVVLDAWRVRLSASVAHSSSSPWRPSGPVAYNSSSTPPQSPRLSGTHAAREKEEEETERSGARGRDLAWGSPLVKL